MKHAVEQPCLPQSEAFGVCKYAPNCSMSNHHVFPRYLGKLGVMEAMAEGNVERAKLIRDFIASDGNIRVGCRLLHDEWDKNNPTELPDDETMRQVAYGN